MAPGLGERGQCLTDSGSTLWASTMPLLCNVPSSRYCRSPFQKVSPQDLRGGAVLMTTTHVASRELALDRAPHERRIVPHDGAAGDLVAGGAEEIRDRAAARVGLLGAGVAHRDDETTHRLRCLAFVFGDAARRHGGDCNSIEKNAVAGSAAVLSSIKRKSAWGIGSLAC